jgi:hypothetical protein
VGQGGPPGLFAKLWLQQPDFVVVCQPLRGVFLGADQGAREGSQGSFCNPLMPGVSSIAMGLQSPRRLCVVYCFQTCRLM